MEKFSVNSFEQCGVVYDAVSVEDVLDSACLHCAFYKRLGCFIAPDCSELSRPDKRRVYFVARDKEKSLDPLPDVFYVKGRHGGVLYYGSESRCHEFMIKNKLSDIYYYVTR